MMPTFPKVGLDALLTPENCAVLLIDHQPSQLANVNSHDPTLVINNVTALAKTAKAYGVPTILTTINSKRGDDQLLAAVKNTRRKELVIAALWSEMCLAQPATQTCTLQRRHDQRREHDLRRVVAHADQ